MSKDRRGAFQFLDTEWRRSVWKTWLGNIFLPPVPPPVPVPEPVEAPPAPAAASTSIPAPVAECDPRELSDSPSEASNDAPLETDPKRISRARFELLIERLSGVEDALDALNRRFATRLSYDRRAANDGIGESVLHTLERQTVAFEEVALSLERFEQRLERIERQLGRSNDGRSSRFPSRRTMPPDAADDDARPSRVTSWTLADGEDNGGSSMHGSLTDMSLATVMAMLELERRTGRLRVTAEEGAIACFEVRDGGVTSSRVNESDLDPVDCVRQVLAWRNGRFWFRQSTGDEAPRALGSLLLEATRQNDEALAEAGAR